MHLLFLLPLGIALAAGLIFSSCADEMAYLTASVTVASSVVSLVIAPWQIQLLILVLILIFSRRIWQPKEPSLEFEDYQQQKPAPFSGVTHEATKAGKYRGVTYEPKDGSTAKTAEGEVVGKYRGSPCKIKS